MSQADSGRTATRRTMTFMDTFTNQGLWKAVESRDRARRRPVRLRRAIDGRLLPALLPEPAAASRSRRVLSGAGDGRGERLPACRRCHPEREADESDARRHAGATRVRSGRAQARRAVDQRGRWRAPAARASCSCSVRSGACSGCRRATTSRRAGSGAFSTRCATAQRVTDAIYESGYGSPSRVYESMRLPGMTPATYGRGGAGARSRGHRGDRQSGACSWRRPSAACARSSRPDGRRGCSTHSRAEFPRATIARASSGHLDAMANAAHAVAEGHAIRRTCRSTSAARRFSGASGARSRGFRAARRASYTEVARAIGQPTAVRAVARACATNPIALVVPCHRVVREDGDLGGYRWGTDTKRALLKNERALGKSGSQRNGKRLP